MSAVYEPMPPHPVHSPCNASEVTLCGLQEDKTASLLYPATALGLTEDIVPELMQYRDVPKASETTLRANVADPLNVYIKDTPDKPNDTKYRRAISRALVQLDFARNAHEKTVWTVNHGEAFMLLGDPQHTHGPLTRLVGRLTGAAGRLLQSPEQKKRTAEFLRNVEDAVKGALGGGVARMVAVSGLSTAPERQGRGYGSALVRVATDLADARGVASWLVSSNVGNRGFYGALGFEVVRTFYMGAENPTWKQKPVPVDVMVRKVKV